MFRLGGSSSNQSSVSYANDRHCDHKAASRISRDSQPHPGEISLQLGVIQEDRSSDPGDHHYAESSADGPNRNNKKSAKHKGKEAAGGERVRNIEVEIAVSGDNIKPTVDIVCAESPRMSASAAHHSCRSKLLDTMVKDVRHLLAAPETKGGLSHSQSSSNLVGNDTIRVPPVTRASSSRRSSRTDMNFIGDPHRRGTSVISATNSYGSGLDDDDLIDPLRDVGIAVNILGGYFAWQPQAVDSVLSDINFTADAGWFRSRCCLPGL